MSDPRPRGRESATEQSVRFTRSPDRTTIAYALSGTGPPLVKVANWLTHLELDWTSPVWRPWLQALTRGRRLVRYDERGCGLSDRDVDDLSFDRWVEDLEAVVDAAGLDRFSLFGMSQGGPVAIAYAVRHPERVRAMILYGSYATGWRHRNAEDFRRREEALMALMEDGWGRDNPAFRQVFTMMFLPEGTPRQIAWFNDLQRRTTSPHVAARLEEEFGSIDVRHLLEQVRCPTLVLHARHDEVIPFEAGRGLAARIPGARFVELDSRNHVLLEDEPAWPRFVDEVASFLAEHDDGHRDGDAEFLARLTGREREVLDLLAGGLDNPAIAEALSISPKTVKNHVTRVFSKLGVRTRSLAVVMGREAGLGRSRTPVGGDARAD